jgi:hypothetical protein
MMKKKNTNSKHSLADILVVLICLGGALFGIYMFWQDLNKTLAKLSETPVGIISYKYNGVQRRFSNQFMWSQLQTDSPVYNGDIIHTADLSDTTISFQDKNSIELAENSLIQIFYGPEGARIELSGGTISASAKSGGMVIVSGDKEITLNAGSTLKADSTGNDLDIEVISGTVTLNAGGVIQTLEAGTAVTAFADGRIETPPRVEAPPVPEPAVPETPAVPVYSAERTQVSEGSPPKPPAIAINPAPAPLPLLPAPGNMSPAAGFIIDVAVVRGNRSIAFTWNAVAGADAYVFTLYRESVNDTPVFNISTAETSYTINDISALDNGNFIWHVEAVNLSGTPRRGRSAESRFAVDIPPPAKPVLGVSGTIYGN